MVRSIKARLQAREEAMLPGPPIMEFEFHLRMSGEDDEIIRITNFFPESEPADSDRTWIRSPDEIYEDFRQRAQDDVMGNLLPGPHTALFYEHVDEENNIVHA